ncbi:MAG: response regulator [Thermodesulfobacteriota bacterium]
MNPFFNTSQAPGADVMDWRRIFQAVGHAMLILDPQFRILAANQAAVDSLGYPETDLHLRKCHTVFHGLESPPANCPMVSLLKTGKFETAQMEVEALDGVYLVSCTPVLDQRGAVSEIVHTATDISGRKAAEAALAEREKLYRSYFEDALSGDYISTPEGTLIDCNPAFVEMFGFPSREAAMTTDMRRIYDSPVDRTAFIDQLTKEKKLVRKELSMKRLNGERIHVLENVVGTFDEKGELLRFKGYLIDISDQKKLEAQLRQAAKMEAIGTLAGGIAHDFNNMLMAIQGNASLALADSDRSSEVHARIENIIQCVRDASQLTMKLLGFARGGKYDVTATDMNQLILKTYETFGRTKKDIRFFRQLENPIWTVEVDRVQIEQVLLNLYVNAWQAMPGGGSLYIHSQNMVLQEDLTAPYNAEPGRYVKVSVTDTGVGMEPAVLERVFEPFFTTKEIGRGTGLGLASAYGIVQNHKGFIMVKSELGVGSTFTIFLPASKKKAAPAASADHHPHARGSETILLVDDEAVNIDVTRRILEKLGYHPLWADNGFAALDIYRQNKAGIDLVILDLIMPDMSGAETYDRLKEINPRVKVLLSSGYSIDGTAAAMLSQGCKGFIQKPFTVEKLSQKIRRILDTG